MDQLLVDRPGWLDWPWALRALDDEVRVTGEEVRPDEGMAAVACLVGKSRWSPPSPAGQIIWL